eukprot:TRINITY_DN3514_c0_g1_i5.p2 TRINITY_DN3514_c0_g1~~TRINITY_DN3514_c0_g1_i5.p2  ORF type:complete len:145 (-),score=27.64 TRINITY_DN3514_c0_g1_i5:330-764(-)
MCIRDSPPPHPNPTPPPTLILTLTQILTLQYTESIQNHPADLCPGLGSFTKRHPAALLAHGNEVLRLIAGSGCCELFADDAFLETRLATELSPAYRCFQDEMRAGWLVHGENPGAGRASVSATEQPSYLLRVPLEVPMLSLKVP